MTPGSLDVLGVNVDLTAVCTVLLMGALLWHAWYSSSKADAPIMGSNALFGYLTALKTQTGAMNDLLRAGYKQYKGRAFQLPGLRAWVIYVAGEQIQDLRKGRDDTFSFREEVNDTVSMQYTFGPSIANNQWHAAVVRKQMTANLAAKFPDVYDEISCAFAEELDLPENGDWKEIPAFNTFMSVICRVSNRLFLGLPLCRDEEFTRISRDFTVQVSMAGFIISLVPPFLKPLVGRYFTPAPAAIRGFEKYLIPIIEERKKQEAELGEAWNEKKPFDFLQWMMDAAEGDQREAKDLNLRMLGVNFAATHTSTMTFTHAFYWLAANTQYIPVLREEVEAVVAEHGWTKDAVNAMVRVDSFLKESARVSGIGSVSMGRKVMRAVTLSDGTQVPKGAHVAVNLWGVHRDPKIYDNPDVFDPWRFSRRVETGESAVKHAFTTASSDFLFWGGGSHVCAGRYFASQELKAMTAHIVMYYDIKMANEGVRPEDTWFGTNCIPNRQAIALFRKKHT
ncbi:cytochrome P450 [Calocera cornea HHB12733]|uniref:Cytochrome P450 n=1 Tax=Calocera cornea HHB12733 TaxID=1353952 RepID=A0A165CHW7_9BASI|nr:cytochrome P450 [Calocera cornea HHB12733]